MFVGGYKITETDPLEIKIVKQKVKIVQPYVQPYEPEKDAVVDMNDQPPQYSPPQDIIKEGHRKKSKRHHNIFE